MASLKDQLDQAGYDTSSLDEQAVLKQLSDAGYDVSSFTPSQPSFGQTAMSAVKRILPSAQTLEAPMNASKKLGTMVEAGGAGIGDLDTAILPRIANNLPPVAIAQGLGAIPKFNEPPIQPTLNQASTDVNAVMNGLTPETSAGKAGKFVGSFFTPNQIAMTAAGEGIVSPILKGLGAVGNAANKVGEVLAPASEAAIPGVEKAAGNALSTLSGVGTPELETVMGAGREAVQGAKTFPQLAEDVAGSMNKLTDHINTLEKTANATLDAENSIPLKTMTDSIAEQLNKLNADPAPTQATESAKKTLNAMLEQLKNKRDLTEPEVAKWVKGVQGKINWNDPLGTETADALTHIQSTVNDALKTANPDYATAEGSLADAVNLKSDLSRAMGISKEPGFQGKFAPENVSVAKLKGLLNPDNALETKKMLSQFSQVPGVPNYVDLAKQSAAKAALQQGFRARLAGLLAGMAPDAYNAVKSGANAAVNAIPGLPSAGNAVYQGLSQ